MVQEELIPYLTEYGKENPEDKIRIKTRFGNIDVELFHDTPLHRANFIFLVKHDYFDETFFHRVAEGFVVQGGNSDNPSTNKKRHYIGDYLIPSEFDAGHKHVRGAFSAAKYAEQNVSKASSPFEFFIVQSESGAHHLDNDHTVFGRVINGMDVVDKISKVKVDQGEWPLQNIYLDVEILE
ncbi:MAG TPA: peptidylprolyl isomerase [Salinimicrobium catena]|uniref:Peptidyl-prolyl cis-trans isomerase n=1 Tax=Salinimicrobium catena TaxID=390640 RepID=A0A7C2QYP6_9FLAO|nr:peptidylprolyl isomerase [Salinimicrobium catena]